LRVLALLPEIAFNSRTQNVTRFDGSRINIAVGIVEKPLRMSSNGRHGSPYPVIFHPPAGPSGGGACGGGEGMVDEKEKKKEFEECQE
jgi:hypothetical protein